MTRARSQAEGQEVGAIGEEQPRLKRVGFPEVRQAEGEEGQGVGEFPERATAL